MDDVVSADIRRAAIARRALLGKKFLRGDVITRMPGEEGVIGSSGSLSSSPIAAVVIDGCDTLITEPGGKYVHPYVHPNRCMKKLGGVATPQLRASFWTGSVAVALLNKDAGGAFSNGLYVINPEFAVALVYAEEVGLYGVGQDRLAKWVMNERKERRNEWEAKAR